MLLHPPGEILQGDGPALVLPGLANFQHSSLPLSDGKVENKSITHILIPKVHFCLEDYNQHANFKDVKV